MPGYFCPKCDEAIVSERAVMVEGSILHQDCWFEIRRARRRLKSPPSDKSWIKVEGARHG